MSNFVKVDGGYKVVKTIRHRPKFDQKYWSGINIETPHILVSRGFFHVKPPTITNGLTAHRDHKWMIEGSIVHDEGLGEGRRIKPNLKRACVDRLLLSMWLDGVAEGHSMFERSKRRIMAYTHYWAVRAWSIVKG